VNYEFLRRGQAGQLLSGRQMRSFQGYARPNGRVGTRNYLAIISSVNCSASVSHYVADRVQRT